MIGSAPGGNGVITPKEEKEIKRWLRRGLATEEEVARFLRRKFGEERAWEIVNRLVKK